MLQHSCCSFIICSYTVPYFLIQLIIMMACLCKFRKEPWRCYSGAEWNLGGVSYEEVALQAVQTPSWASAPSLTHDRFFFSPSHSFVRIYSLVSFWKRKKRSDINLPILLTKQHQRSKLNVQNKAVSSFPRSLGFNWLMLPILFSFTHTLQVRSSRKQRTACFTATKCVL